MKRSLLWSCVLGIMLAAQSANACLIAEPGGSRCEHQVASLTPPKGLAERKQPVTFEDMWWDRVHTPLAVFFEPKSIAHTKLIELK